MGEACKATPVLVKRTPQQMHYETHEVWHNKWAITLANDLFLSGLNIGFICTVGWTAAAVLSIIVSFPFQYKRLRFLQSRWRHMVNQVVKSNHKRILLGY